MEIFNQLKDRLNKAEFSVSPNKKPKSISADFKNAFGLSLVFYKGNIIAEDSLTLSGLNKKISTNLNINTGIEIKTRGSMKVKEVEKLFKDAYNVKVQVKDSSAKMLIDDNWN